MENPARANQRDRVARRGGAARLPGDIGQREAARPALELAPQRAQPRGALVAHAAQPRDERHGKRLEGHALGGGRENVRGRRLEHVKGQRRHHGARVPVDDAQRQLHRVANDLVVAARAQHNEVVERLVRAANDARAGELLADYVRELIADSGQATSLAAWNVHPDSLSQLAEEASMQWTGNFNPRPVDQQSFVSDLSLSLQ